MTLETPHCNISTLEQYVSLQVHLLFWRDLESTSLMSNSPLSSEIFFLRVKRFFSTIFDFRASSVSVQEEVVFVSCVCYEEGLI